MPIQESYEVSVPSNKRSLFIITLLTKHNIVVASGCGAYGYDINQLCAAWTEAPEEMTREQYQVGENGCFIRK